MFKRAVGLFTFLFWSTYLNSKRALNLLALALIIAVIISLSSFIPVYNSIYGIVNSDKGVRLQFSDKYLSFSEQIIDNLEKQGIKIKLYDTLDLAISDLGRGKISGVLFFPENFTIFSHLANISKTNTIKPRISLYTNSTKYSKEIKVELFNAFSNIVESKVVPIEITETISNASLPERYHFLAFYIIFIYLFSLFSSYNFGYYLIQKQYYEFLKSINQTLESIFVVLSVLISLLAFLITSLFFSAYNLKFSSSFFLMDKYLPLIIFLIALSSSLLGYAIAYLGKKRNLLSILVVTAFAVHLITFPASGYTNIVSITLQYLSSCIMIISSIFTSASFNLSVLPTIYLGIIYSIFSAIILYFSALIYRERY